MLVAIDQRLQYRPVASGTTQAMVRGPYRGLGQTEAGPAACGLLDCALWAGVGLGGGALLALVVSMIIGAKTKKGGS